MKFEAIKALIYSLKGYSCLQNNERASQKIIYRSLKKQTSAEVINVFLPHYRYFLMCFNDYYYKTLWLKTNYDVCTFFRAVCTYRTIWSVVRKCYSMFTLLGKGRLLSLGRFFPGCSWWIYAVSSNFVKLWFF